MAFDTFTFDEGIAPGGMRTKSEIRTLICYLFNSVKEPMSKDIIIDAISKDSLANYFETSSCFDDLIANEVIIPVDDEDNRLFTVSEKGKMIANELETTVAYSVKEKAYLCATKLLAQKKKERENTVEITKSELGYDVTCKISGGELDLLSFTLFAPDLEQAMLMKKNFYDNPTTIYKVMIALLTKDKECVGEALENLYGIIQ